jgi:YVTN family beta-propeller protein
VSAERRRRWPLVGGLAFLACLVVAVPGYRHSAEHVRHMSGNESASLTCVPCHVLSKHDGPIGRLVHRQYLSPLDIAVADDGEWLYVTAEDSDVLLTVDLGEKRVARSIPVGSRPHSVVVARDGNTAYVSNRWSNSVSIVDLAAGEVTGDLPVGTGPSGLALTPDGSALYVANTVSNDISLVDLASGRERKRLSAGNAPYAVSLTEDGESVYVTSRLSSQLAFREPPVAELTVVGAVSERVADRLAFHSAHLIEGIDVTPEGDWVVVTLVRPKNLIPATQVGRGWMLTFGLGIVDRTQDRKIIQLPLDDVNAFYADPYDVVVTPDGQRAFVSHSGADVITVVDLHALRELIDGLPADSLAVYANHLGLSDRYVVKRIATGANPKGLALSPDGQRLYVAERLDDRISVIDVETAEIVDAIDLGSRRETFLRRGQKLFHSAANTFQGQFSCRSCHPEGHHDALTYDLEPDGLGRNIVNNISLRGLAETAPYKWTGKNESLYRQCGFRFAKWLTRTEPFSEDELYSLVGYILSLSPAPNRYRPVAGQLTEAQLRGRAIFERAVTNEGGPIPPENRCSTCHPPPLFTNRAKADVGSSGPTDTEVEFDVPALSNLYGQGPFLHDGRALTLEELWTKYNPDDTHGVANDLTKAQLNDLIEYLRVLGGSEEPSQETQD